MPRVKASKVIEKTAAQARKAIAKIDSQIEDLLAAKSNGSREPGTHTGR